MSDIKENKHFDYIWVLRCSGKNQNRNVEYRMIPNVPTARITPLLEVIDTTLLHTFTYSLRTKYGKVMVDFPSYLLEASNKFSEDIAELKAQYTTTENFFKSNKSAIDIPVISAQHIGFGDYSDENSILLNVKDDFEKVAVRIRVPTYDLSGTTDILNSYKTLLGNMSIGDILLLDIFSMSGSESNIDSNIQLMTTIAKEHGLNISVLNAFEPVNASHNYGPIFSYRYKLSGFGDFATEKRYPSSGGPGENKIIRHYDWTRFVLREYKEKNYSTAASTLRSSNCWRNHPDHVLGCTACSDAAVTHSEGHSYWKSFRVLHYLHSIANETQHKYNSVTSDQDLDPDGYDNLFSVGRA